MTIEIMHFTDIFLRWAIGPIYAKDKSHIAIFATFEAALWRSVNIGYTCRPISISNIYHSGISSPNMHQKIWQNHPQLKFYIHFQGMVLSFVYNFLLFYSCIKTLFRNENSTVHTKIYYVAFKIHTEALTHIYGFTTSLVDLM